LKNAQRRTKRQDGKRARKLYTGRGEKTHKEKLKEEMLNVQGNAKNDSEKCAKESQKKR
jgi:hypothetical protein